MRLSFLLAASLLTALTLPAAARDRSADGEAALAKITADRAVGTPVSCINLRDIRSSEIVDDTAIVYRMNNGTLFVNRPNGGGLLDRDDILVTRTIGTRLCSIDIVNLVDRTSQFPSGSVSLRKFGPNSEAQQPITKTKEVGANSWAKNPNPLNSRQDSRPNGNT